jgi:hypothetical protein
MTDIEILDLVTRMRDAQKTYFRTRTPVDLMRSKDLEKQVDKALSDRLFLYKPLI